MKRLCCAMACAAVFTLLLETTADAHEAHQVGELTFTPGWANEPALLGQANAVQLFIERGGEPVTGAENSLRVTVSLGNERSDPLKLRAVVESPGEYRADMIPTVVGGYTFKFAGTLGDEKINESFTAPADGFAEVEGTTGIAFPKAAPTTTELTERLNAMQDELDDARSSVDLPRTLAMAGIVLAVVALIVAASGRVRRRA